MIQQSVILEEVKKRIREATLHKNPILFTLVEKVESKDPLLFFKNGERHFLGQRFFWTNSDGTLAVSGLGDAYTIEMNEKHFPFLEIERKWEQFLINSVIQQNEQIAGTGPLLFGGFSFDSGKEKSILWEKFPHAKFTLPKYMYTAKNNEAWLTANIVCHQDSIAEDIVRDIYTAKLELLQGVNSFSDRPDNNEYFENEIEPESWMESVREVAEDIQAGELEKVVLAREMRLIFKNKIDIPKVLFHLRYNQENSYIFAFENGQDCFVGASPERLVSKKGNQLLSTCLAGSIGRGKTEVEDEELGEALLNDKKNLIEHEVVVHMIKEAMQEVCHSILTPDQPTLYKTKHIQHLFTPVIGICKDTISLLSVVEKLHPTPALGGFPKQKAIQKIREIEILDRGWYAAPIGWIDYKEDGEFAVAIRSGLIQENEVSLFAGCGIVGDSDPVSEYRETEIKFRPMLSALGGVKHEKI